jgi:hypothetical protein
MPCAHCPCPEVCLAREIWCQEWAPSGDPGKRRHICDRSRIAAGLEGPREYPPIAHQAANLGRALWDWAVAGFAIASEEEQARRLAICGDCPLRNAEDRRCWRCGCYTDAKVKLRTEHCPEGKW